MKRMPSFEFMEVDTEKLQGRKWQRKYSQRRVGYGLLGWTHRSTAKAAVQTGKEGPRETEDMGLYEDSYG